MKIRPLLKWYGGKTSLVPLLLTLLPRHETYCEVFGGSGILLLSKPPAKVEVYNDVDMELVNFFRVVRDPALARQLRAELELTLYARSEHKDCIAGLGRTSDSVERARRFFVA